MDIDWCVGTVLVKGKSSAGGARRSDVHGNCLKREGCRSNRWSWLTEETQQRD